MDLNTDFLIHWIFAGCKIVSIQQKVPEMKQNYYLNNLLFAANMNCLKNAVHAEL